MENARKDTYLANARAAIDAARNDYMVNEASASKWQWSKDEINALLEKKLDKTPFGEEYTAVYVWRSTTGYYKLCMKTANVSGGFINTTWEKNLSKSSVALTGTATCSTLTAQPTDSPTS